MEFRDKQIAAPRLWETFEDLCLSLFKAIWKDDLAQKHGRNGQPQHGVDVFGSPDGRRGIVHGVQCKGKDQTYGHKATLSELKAEIKKAEGFKPPLEHWVFATTAPKEAELQLAAREISRARASVANSPSRSSAGKTFAASLPTIRASWRYSTPSMPLISVASLPR